MATVKLRFETSYCGAPADVVEYEYYGTEKEFKQDHHASTDILNMLLCGEVPHYGLDYEFIPDEEENDEDEECDEE